MHERLGVGRSPSSTAKVQHRRAGRREGEGDRERPRARGRRDGLIGDGGGRERHERLPQSAARGVEDGRSEQRGRWPNRTARELPLRDRGGRAPVRGRDRPRHRGRKPAEGLRDRWRRNPEDRVSSACAASPCASRVRSASPTSRSVCMSFSSRPASRAEVAAVGERAAQRRLDLRPRNARQAARPPPGARQPRHRGRRSSSRSRSTRQRRVARRRQQSARAARAAANRSALGSRRTAGRSPSPRTRGERVHLRALDPAQALRERVLARLQLRQLGERAIERRRGGRGLGRQLGVLRGDAADRIVLLGRRRRPTASPPRRARRGGTRPRIAGRAFSAAVKVRESRPRCRGSRGRARGCARRRARRSRRRPRARAPSSDRSWVRRGWRIVQRASIVTASPSAESKRWISTSTW